MTTPQEDARRLLAALAIDVRAPDQPVPSLDERGKLGWLAYPDDVEAASEAVEATFTDAERREVHAWVERMMTHVSGDLRFFRNNGGTMLTEIEIDGRRVLLPLTDERFERWLAKRLYEVTEFILPTARVRKMAAIIGRDMRIIEARDAMAGMTEQDLMLAIAEVVSESDDEPDPPESAA
jgi:hypothetical protein